MHRSFFALECADKPESLELSELASEWLFASRFWTEFNEKYGTIFDQYEEDSASLTLIPFLIAAIENNVNSLNLCDLSTLNFVYAKNKGGDSLKAKVSKSDLILELTNLSKFFSIALEKKNSVICSL